MCPQGKPTKLHFFQGTLTQTSKKIILRALINFHYVMILQKKHHKKNTHHQTTPEDLRWGGILPFGGDFDLGGGIFT